MCVLIEIAVESTKDSDSDETETPEDLMIEWRNINYRLLCELAVVEKYRTNVDSSCSYSL